MATVHVTMRNVSAVGEASVYGESRAAQTMTPTATSAASTIVAGIGEVVTIKSRDTDVFVAFGTAPVAASGSGDLITAGERVDFLVATGSKVAIITA